MEVVRKRKCYSAEPGAWSSSAPAIKDELDIDDNVLQQTYLHTMLREIAFRPMEEDRSTFQLAHHGSCHKEKHKLQNGVCRCCFARGRFKPMDYVDTGALTESCADMLQTTFSIKFEQPWDVSVEGANLICDACESRLRNAHAFRQQVIDAQSNFILHKRTKLLTVRIERLDIKSFVKTMPKHEVPIEMHVSDEEMAYGEELCMNTIPQAKPKNVNVKKTVPFKIIKPKITTAEIKAKIIRSRERQKVEGAQIKDNNCNRDSKDTKAKPGAIKCNFCNMLVQPVNEVVWKHLQTRHGVDPGKKPEMLVSECDICGKAFSSCKKKVAHVKNNHFKCTKCPKICRSVFDKEQHLQGTHPLPCKQCEKSFFSRKALRSHRNKVHKFECKSCKALFNSCTVRDRHMVKDHGAPEYACGACDKTFDLITELNYHKRRDHLMERNFKCTICDYAGFSSSVLKNHMYTHSGVKNFECVFCSKKFSHPKTLKNHVRIHTGEKRQVCKLCGAAFVQRASLKYHFEKFHPNDS